MREYFKRNYISVILFSVFIFVAGGYILFTQILSRDYNKVYNTPTVKDCVLNVEGYDFASRKLNYQLGGEWEFYYNKWILTDGEECSPDGIIKLPARWNDELGISNKGYASYKITVRGFKGGEKITLTLTNYMGAYRSFINGNLCTTCGKMSKTAKGVYANGRGENITSYTVKEGEEIELVMELAYNDFGGLYAVPWLCGSDNAIYGRQSFMSFSIDAIMGCMFYCCLISIVYNIAVNRKNNTFNFMLFLLATFLNYLTCDDAALRFSNFGIRIDYRIYACTCFISILLMTLSFLFQLKREGFYKMKYGYAVFPFIVCFLAVFPLHATIWQVVPVSIAGLYGLYFVYKVAFSDKPLSQKIIYLMTGLLMYGIFVTELSDGMGLIVYGTEATVSYILLALSAVELFANFIGVKQIQLKAEAAQRTEAELDAIKEKSLRAQIKPHFIFNTLTCIQQLYHEDAEQGEKALLDFSGILRSNVDSENQKFVPFERELDYVQQYVRLANMSKGTNIALYYDVNYTDFELPVLTLQPFVENAVKHGGIGQLEEGYVQLSSEESGGTVTVKIADNGCGFVPEKVGSRSHGIKNCVQRLKSMLGAKVSINSVIGKGTIVEIKFGKNTYENNNYR